LNERSYTPGAEPPPFALTASDAIDEALGAAGDRPEQAASAAAPTTATMSFAEFEDRVKQDMGYLCDSG